MNDLATVPESEDIIEFVEKLTNAVIQAKADGKIDWKDLRFTPPLVPAFRDAIKDGEKIPSEVQNAPGEVTDAMFVRLSAAVLALGDAIQRPLVKQ